MDKTSKRISVYMDNDLLRKCDITISKKEISSRSEFISKALESYLAYININDNSSVLTPALESVITAKILDTEERISRVIFKQSVELAMLMNVIAATNHIDINELNELRNYCEEIVKKSCGRYNFDNAVKLQKNEE